MDRSFLTYSTKDSVGEWLSRVRIPHEKVKKFFGWEVISFGCLSGVGMGLIDAHRFSHAIYLFSVACAVVGIQLLFRVSAIHNRWPWKTLGIVLVLALVWWGDAYLVGLAVEEADDYYAQVIISLSHPQNSAAPSIVVVATSSNPTTVEKEPSFTRQELDDLLNSNIHQIDDWRGQWQKVQIRASSMENDAHNFPPQSREKMLSRAKQIRRDPMRAAIEPREMKKIVSTSNRLQKEVVTNWLSVVDREALPQPNQVSAIFKKFESNDYSVGDVTNLDSYMRTIQRRFEDSKSTN
jgi:hypothetical protein